MTLESCDTVHVTKRYMELIPGLRTDQRWHRGTSYWKPRIWLNAGTQYHSADDWRRTLSRSSRRRLANETKAQLLLRWPRNVTRVEFSLSSGDISDYGNCFW